MIMSGNEAWNRNVTITIDIIIIIIGVIGPHRHAKHKLRPTVTNVPCVERAGSMRPMWPDSIP